MNGAWYEIDANEQDSPALLIYPDDARNQPCKQQWFNIPSLQ